MPWGTSFPLLSLVQLSQELSFKLTTIFSTPHLAKQEKNAENQPPKNASTFQTKRLYVSTKTQVRFK